MLNRQLTTGAAFEDQYWASQGLRTGSAYNDFLLSQNKLARGQRLPTSASRRESSGNGWSGGFVGVFFFALVGPGTLILEPIMGPLVRWLINALLRIRPYVVVTFVSIGAILAFLPYTSTVSISVAESFQISHIPSLLLVAAVFACMFAWAGYLSLGVLYGAISLGGGILSFLISIAIYLGATYLGYYSYLNFFNGTEVPFLTGMFELVSTGTNKLVGLIKH